MVPFESIMIPLSGAWGFSLIIERILEFIQNIIERFTKAQEEKKLPSSKEINETMDDIEKKYIRAQFFEENETDAEKAIKNKEKLKTKLITEKDYSNKISIKQELTNLEKNTEWSENFSQSTLLVQPATDPNDGKILKRNIILLLGFALGIIFVHFSGLQLFNSFLSQLQYQKSIPEWMDYVFTGLLIGGGSGPMHILVRFITQKKVVLEQKSDISESPKNNKSKLNDIKSFEIMNSNPVSATTDNEWLTIPYKGGVDREKLADIHIRDKNPELIVYHHTAMNSDSTFEDVVRVIKNQTDSHGNRWVTGYNCVVLADGSIYPFCRWDRYGNHAAGYNRKSLGIAFNGNYETNRNVPYSNPDGRCGSPAPSEEQLKAVAKTVTLWTFLYSIEVDFEKSIIPHANISSKTCPGSNFPDSNFKKLIEFYRSKWEKSANFLEYLESFKLKPYLFV